MIENERAATALQEVYAAYDRGEFVPTGFRQMIEARREQLSRREQPITQTATDQAIMMYEQL